MTKAYWSSLKEVLPYTGQIRFHLQVLTTQNIFAGKLVFFIVACLGAIGVFLLPDISNKRLEVWLTQKVLELVGDFVQLVPAASNLVVD